MSTGEENNITESTDGGGGAEGGLSDALTGDGGSEFVIPEQRKTISRGTLLLFGVVIAAMGGLYFMHARGGPSAAAAASEEAKAANATISQFLTSGEQSVAK